ncbi:MAG TPA: hypothetical protein DIC34_00915 [Treponema sp.]|nr:MAG: hypothetical protein A2001_02830 [Treponema sp. GWC1_61_84]OHE70797.1 MAG: hypothetical protein A2413_03470 [Treponema sp. RIFOXYC1_FULL_61_9]HCM25105.1 hypothetical protein [Treponema sp.]
MRRRGSLRGKMLAITVFLLAVVGTATLYTGFATAQLAGSLGLLFQRNQLIEDIRTALAGSAIALGGYLSSRSEANLAAFRQNSGILRERARILNRSVRVDEALLLQRELAGLVDRFLSDADAAVEAKSRRYMETSSERYESALRTAELVRTIIERIERRNLSASIDAYTGLDARIGAIVATNAALVVAAILMAFTVFVRFTWAITVPLSTLADSARAIARGDYDRELPSLEAAEEIATTAAAFENMRRSVRAAFEELKSKAEIERRLIEEELQLVDMDRKLKDAELLALQAQINPHFLYNTLSAGMQLALAEGADRTADFIEKLGGFIRYALRSPSRSVSVADEIGCLERYVWLLRLRFGERFTFSIEADPAVLGMETPALVLQPLVENAVTHGLHTRESGGSVRISARREGAAALLEVSDTGVGMDAKTVSGLLEEGGAVERQVSEGGIGLRNVIRRVTLATAGRGSVRLVSRPGEGTTVTVVLPSGEEET